MEKGKHFLVNLGFGQRAKVLLWDSKYFESFPFVLVIAKEELVESIVFENGDEGIGNNHERLDVVEAIKGINMFELSNLANGVLLLAQIVLHDVPEGGSIFLRIKLWEDKHFIRP